MSAHVKGQNHWLKFSDYLDHKPQSHRARKKEYILGENSDVRLVETPVGVVWIARNVGVKVIRKNGLGEVLTDGAGVFLPERGKTLYFENTQYPRCYLEVRHATGKER